jgi:phosphatidate cytidylyltransferase
LRNSIPLTRPSARAHVVIGVALGGVAVTTLLVGRIAVSAFVAALLVAAYADLRRLLAVWGHVVTFALGAAGVGGFLWSGYIGRLELLPWTGASLIVALLVSRVVLHEAGVRVEGVTGDVAATVGAAGVVGVLGAHILLIRAVPRFGFRGLLVFGLAVLLNDAVAFFVGRWRGRHTLAARLSPAKTWEGTIAGFAASVVVGLVAGLVLNPPFDIASGLALGAAMGVLAPVGDLLFSVIKRSAGVRGSARYFGPMGGALDVVDSLLFCAPAFYWAFRTIAL